LRRWPAFFALMAGGVLGLEAVGSDRWGGPALDGDPER